MVGKARPGLGLLLVKGVLLTVLGDMVHLPLPDHRHIGRLVAPNFDKSFKQTQIEVLLELPYWC